MYLGPDRSMHYVWHHCSLIFPNLHFGRMAAMDSSGGVDSCSVLDIAIDAMAKAA